MHMEHLQLIYLSSIGINIPESEQGIWGQDTVKWFEWMKKIVPYFPFITDLIASKFHEEVKNLQVNLCCKQVFESENYYFLQKTNSFVKLTHSNINQILGSTFPDEVEMNKAIDNVYGISAMQNKTSSISKPTLQFLEGSDIIIVNSQDTDNLDMPRTDTDSLEQNKTSDSDTDD